MSGPFTSLGKEVLANGFHYADAADNTAAAHIAATLNGSWWQDIASAPRDGRPFLALNHDREVWVAKYVGERLVFRINKIYEPKRFEHVAVDGETLLREDKSYAEANECWRNDWTYWTRLYEFKPSHWCTLPDAPTTPSTEGQGE